MSAYTAFAFHTQSMRVCLYVDSLRPSQQF